MTFMGTVALKRHEAEYVQTIVDAAAAGTVSVDGLKVCGWLMRGWTLEAAKHQVYVVEPRLLALAGKLS